MKLFAKTTCMHALWVAVIWTELKNHPLSASRGKEGGNNPIDGPQHRRRVPTHHLPVVGGRWAAGGVAFVHAQHAHTHTHTHHSLSAAQCHVPAGWGLCGPMWPRWRHIGLRWGGCGCSGSFPHLFRLASGPASLLQLWNKRPDRRSTEPMGPIPEVTSIPTKTTSPWSPSA